MMELEQVLIAGYLSREMKIRLKTELTRREMTFSEWLRERADRWLNERHEHDEQAAGVSAKAGKS
jgi:hypothetical protein